MELLTPLTLMVLTRAKLPFQSKSRMKKQPVQDLEKSTVPFQLKLKALLEPGQGLLSQAIVPMIRIPKSNVSITSQFTSVAEEDRTLVKPEPLLFLPEMTQ